MNIRILEHSDYDKLYAYLCRITSSDISQEEFEKNAVRFTYFCAEEDDMKGVLILDAENMHIAYVYGDTDVCRELVKSAAAFAEKEN